MKKKSLRPDTRWRRIQLALLVSLLPRLADWCTRFTFWTSRVVELHPERDLDRRGTPSLLVTRHQGLIYIIQHFRNRDAVLLASRSRDGQIISSVITHFGYRLARGSGSAGGTRALRELIDHVRDHRRSVGLTGDGPRGPFGSVKMGVVKLARETGAPILPCGVWSSRHKMLANWDQTLIPLPFSRIAISMGEPVWVPEGASWEELEKIRDHVANEIRLRVEEAKASLGLADLVPSAASA